MCGQQLVDDRQLHKHEGKDAVRIDAYKKYGGIQQSTGADRGGLRRRLHLQLQKEEGRYPLGVADS